MNGISEFRILILTVTFMSGSWDSPVRVEKRDTQTYGGQSKPGSNSHGVT